MDGDHLSDLMGSIGDIKMSLGGLIKSVDLLVSAQAETFHLLRAAQHSTATLEAQQTDTMRRVGHLEDTQATQAQQLSESKGAARATRWMIVAWPPVFVAILEVLRALFSTGSHIK